MFVYAKLVRIRTCNVCIRAFKLFVYGKNLFVYKHILFVYVHFGLSIPQFAPLQTCLYAKNCASTMCLYVEFDVCIQAKNCLYTNILFFVETRQCCAST